MTSLNTLLPSQLPQLTRFYAYPLFPQDTVREVFMKSLVGHPKNTLDISFTKTLSTWSSTVIQKTQIEKNNLNWLL